MTAHVADLLDRHVERRDEWLDSAVGALAADRRVFALVLCGSLGRNDGDPWSDVDLVVFVDDDAVDDVVAARLQFVHGFGEALYTLDATWNAPLDGAQVNVLYRLSSGLPLYVDWNVWPRSMLGAPIDTQVLYEARHGAVPRVNDTFARWASYERQPRPDASELGDDALRHAHFGMVPIAAKFFARRRRDRLVGMLTGIGAQDVPESVQGEIAAVRERLAALSCGESPAAIEAVERLCDATQEFVSSIGPRPVGGLGQDGGVSAG